MKYLARAVIVTLVLLVASVYPYELRHVGKKGGTTLRLRDGSLSLSISESLLESVPGIRDKDEVVASVSSAAARWQDAAAVKIGLSTSDLLSISPAGRSGDGVSLLTIAPTPENLLLFSGKNAGAAAYTRIFYNTAGEITEADIVLNPYLISSTKGVPGSYDLESVVIHELGHALGLGHSAILSATMSESTARNGLYGMPVSTDRTLSEDDIAGARALYGPPEGTNDCCASVVATGKVRETGEFGIWAVDAESGRIAAEIRSDGSGTLELKGLSTGEYEIFASRIPSEASPAKFLGRISVSRGQSASLTVPFLKAPGRFSLSQVGFNGQLSNIPVPLNEGGSYRIYLDGRELDRSLEIEIRSPGVTLDSGTFEYFDQASNLRVVSFIVDVAEEIPAGEYPIIVKDKKGNELWLLGAITVDLARNPWVIRQF